MFCQVAREPATQESHCVCFQHNILNHTFGHVGSFGRRFGGMGEAAAIDNNEKCDASLLLLLLTIIAR